MFLAALAFAVDVLRKGALAHAHLALQQHRHLHLGGAVQQANDILHALIVENKAGWIAVLAAAGSLQLGGIEPVALLALLQLLLQGVQLGNIPDIGNHHDDVAFGIENRGAGDDGPLAGFELLLHRHRFPAFQRQQCAGTRNDPAGHQLRHAAAHHLLLAQAADGLVAFIQGQGDGVAIGDVKAIVGRFKNNLEPIALPPKKGIPCPVFRYAQYCWLPFGHAVPSYLFFRHLAEPPVFAVFSGICCISPARYPRLRRPGRKAGAPSAFVVLTLTGSPPRCGAPAANPPFPPGPCAFGAVSSGSHFCFSAAMGIPHADGLTR